MGAMQRPTRVRRRHPPAQRDRILAAYQRSGLTQKKFAAQSGLGYSTLTFWLSQAATAKKSCALGWVAVPNLFSPASAAAAYRLRFPRGVIVEVAPGCHAQELSALWKEVQAL